MLSAISEGLCIIRATLCQHSMEGMANEEATWLLSVCKRAASETSEAFLARMSISYHRCAKLWGNRLLFTTCCSGALNRLLPTMIRQLSPNKQSQAIAYWDGVINTLASDECLNAMPTQFYAMIVPHLERIRRRQPSKVDMSVLGEAVGGDPTMFSHLSESLNIDACPIVFTGAEDLDWIASIGLLITHWDTFMSAMYTRTSALFTHVEVTFSSMNLGLLQ
jgi:hypothetical protein